MTINEFLEAAFPEGEDNSIEWLCFALSQSQIALIIAMLYLNAYDLPEEERASYNEKAQRLLAYLKGMDDDWQDYLTKAIATCEQNKLW